MSKPDWVRVRDERTGHHLTVTRRHATTRGLHVLEDAPAVDRNGRPLPANTRAPKASTKTTSKKEG